MAVFKANVDDNKYQRLKETLKGARITVEEAGNFFVDLVLDGKIVVQKPELKLNGTGHREAV